MKIGTLSDFMKTRILLTLLLGAFGGWSLNAQEDTAMIRKAYSEINAAIPQMKLVKGSVDVDGLTFELNGWKDEGGLRKVVSRVPGEDGDGSEEYYWKDGELIFVFRHYEAAAEDGKKGVQMEDRFYLRDGKLFKWLGTDKQAVSPKREDFALEAERLTELSGQFASSLGAKKKAGVQAEVTGVFMGIEEGDYAHWLMKNGKGEEVSFFILNPDDSVDAVMKAPESFVGKSCRVTVKKSMETIPEAGGKMEVEQVLKVVWGK